LRGVGGAGVSVARMTPKVYPGECGREIWEGGGGLDLRDFDAGKIFSYPEYFLLKPGMMV